MRALQCTQRCGVALRGGVLAPLPHAAARHHQPRQPAPCAAARLPRSAAGPAGGTRAAAHAAAAAAVAAPAPLPLDAASAHTLELQVYIEFTDCFQARAPRAALRTTLSAAPALTARCPVRCAVR
jgi:hypothetical protein